MAVISGFTGRQRTLTWTIPFHLDGECHIPPQATEPGGQEDPYDALCSISSSALKILGSTISATANPGNATLVAGKWAYLSQMVSLRFAHVNNGTLHGHPEVPDYDVTVNVAGAVNPKGTLTLSIPCYQRVDYGPMPGTGPGFGVIGINGLLVTETVDTRNNLQSASYFALCPFTLDWGPLQVQGVFLLSGPIYDLLQVEFDATALGAICECSCAPICANDSFGWQYHDSERYFVKASITDSGKTIGNVEYFSDKGIGIKLYGGLVGTQYLYNALTGNWYLGQKDYFLTKSMNYSQVRRRYSVQGNVRCFQADYPGPWRVNFTGAIAGGGASQLVGPGQKSFAFTQDQPQCNGPNFPVIGDFDYVHAYPDSSIAKELPPYDPVAGTGLMGRALKWDVLKITSAQEVPFYPRKWKGLNASVTGVGSTAVTISTNTPANGLDALGTFDQDFLVAYRYLSFNVVALPNLISSVVVRMNGKSYTVPFPVDGNILIDLANSDNSGYDFQDSIGPFAQQVGDIPPTEFRPVNAIGRWGLKWTRDITIELVSDGGSGAAATLTVTNGIVTSAVITSGGQGYASTPSVVVTGDGHGASVEVGIDGSGHVTTISVVAGGSGYSHAEAEIMGAQHTEAVVQNMKLLRKSKPILEFLKATSGETPFYLAKSNGITINSSWLRGVCAMVDGLMAWEYGDYLDFGNSGHLEPFKISDWIQYVNTLPGWFMAMVQSNSQYVDSTTTSVEEVGGGGVVVAGSDVFDYTGFPLSDSGSTIPGQFRYDFLYAHPGAGDFESGDGYGNHLHPSPYKFCALARGKAWGNAADLFKGLTLNLYRSDTGAFGGSAIVRDDGYWETGLPFLDDGVSYDIFVSARGGKQKGGTVYAHATRRNALGRLSIAFIEAALEQGKPGYFLFTASADGLKCYRSWHPSQPFSDAVTIDQSSDVAEPQPMFRSEGRILSVIYRRGSGTQVDPFVTWRAESIDDGFSWNYVKTA